MASATTDHQPTPGPPLPPALQLGEGTYGTVVAIDRNTVHKRCKVRDDVVFARELAALRDLHDEHIVQLVDSDPPSMLLCLARCLSSLHDWMKCHGVPSAAQRKRWTRDLQHALEHVHAHGLVHRDVKPSNLLLRDDLRLQLCDFGTCVALVPGRCLTLRVGTPNFTAPEALEGDGRYDANVDWWSMGVTLEFMRTRALPVEGTITASDWLRSRDAPHNAETRRIAALTDPDPTRRAPRRAVTRTMDADVSTRRTLDEVRRTWNAHMPHLHFRMRRVAWTWVAEVAATEPLLDRPVYDLAIALLDAIVADSPHPPQTHTLQCYVCACVHVACAIVADGIYDSETWVFLSDKAFDEAQLQRTIDDVLTHTLPYALWRARADDAYNADADAAWRAGRAKQIPDAR